MQRTCEMANNIIIVSTLVSLQWLDIIVIEFDNALGHILMRNKIEDTYEKQNWRHFMTLIALLMLCKWLCKEFTLVGLLTCSL